MSLGAILDDLNKDTTNIDPALAGVALENIVITDVKKDGNLINIQRFSKETIERVNNMFNLIVLKKNVDAMPRVDRGVALEVFTMLPEIGKVEQAKLTTSPSIINKEIMDRVFNSNIEHKMSLDVVDKLYDLERLIQDHLPMIDVLLNYFETFKSAVETKAEVFKNAPPMVVEFKAWVSEGEQNATRNIDLYTEKMEVINRLDDTKLEYPKYSGVLSNKFADVYYNDTLKTLYECWTYVPPMAELSLAGMVQAGRGMIDTLSRYRDDLNRYLTGLSSVRKQEAELNAETIEFINGYDDLASKLETIGCLKSIVETKDNCFDKTAELVEFID